LLTHISLPHNITPHTVTPSTYEQNFLLQKSSWLSVNDMINLSPDAVSNDPISLQNSIICQFHSRSEQTEWQKCILPLFIHSSYVSIPFLYAMHNRIHD